MLCTFRPPTILGDFYRIPAKSPKSSVDKTYRACEPKDQTLRRIRTLHLQERRADTQTPTRNNVFSTHSDTQAVPAFHCIRLCLKAVFRHARVFKTHRHAVYHCLKEVQNHFNTRVFLKRAFRHSRVYF